ncbi:MAG: Ig-like domain-containing protein [Solirubrobacterales bacterium]
MRQSLRANIRAAVLIATAAALVASPAAQGAGMTTHAWMAEEAVQHVKTPELKALLAAQNLTLMSGAQFPDSGYAPGLGYGETAHWEDYTDAFAAQIAAKPECQETLAEPTGPCAQLVAHLMGSAAHGMGDEMWDWLFEPTMPDHGENPSSTSRSRVDDTPGFAELGTLSLGPDFQQWAIDAEHGALDNQFGQLIGSSEYAMDVIAINDYGRTLWSPVPPPIADVQAVYSSLGEPVTEAELMAGHAYVNAALAGERLSVAEAHSVRADFGYSAAHMKTDPGGVDHTAVAIAGYYESVWEKLTGANPAPQIAQVTPAPESDEVPVRWQPAKTEPGPYEGRGGARNRIHVALSNAVDARTLTPETFRVLDSAGEPVPALEGFPKAGPYGSGSGTHSILFYPAGDLEPCERYTAEVTTGLLNRKGKSLATAYRWSFKTETAGEHACPPPPPPPSGDPSPTAAAVPSPDPAPAGEALPSFEPAIAPAAEPDTGDRAALRQCVRKAKKLDNPKRRKKALAKCHERFGPDLAS